MTAPISFLSTLRTMSSYMPPIRCCFKQKKEDILFHAYRKLSIEKPTVFNQEVTNIINLKTFHQYTPYSNSNIMALNYLVSKRIVTIINNIRFMVANCPQYAPKGVDLCLSPKEEAFLSRELMSIFPQKIDLKHKSYIDALNSLAHNNAWHLCFLEGDSLLTEITSFFESKKLLNLKL